MDNDIPIYEVNSSDEDIIDEEQDQIPSTPLETPFIRSLQTTPIPGFQPPQPQQQSKYLCSNFIPNDDNTIFGNDYVIFGLKNNQNLIIKGQFKLQIQRGAIKIDHLVYHSSPKSFNFINSNANSLPLISATQVLDRSKVSDELNEENKHLFTSDYKSVIKITNFKTGLENIGTICPILKNLIWNFNNLSNDDLKTYNDFEIAFHDYSFFPIIKPDNTITITNHKNWTETLENLSNLHAKGSILKILIIGSKNSGKSTLLRLLLQNFLQVNNETPVNYLDLDPGQCEFSKPDSISLNKFEIPQMGNHLSITSPQCQFNHYIGFGSPKDQPTRYNALVRDLINKYNKDGGIKNESLLINTPGWIKGYGTTLTNSLIEQLEPTHIIYLNNGSAPDLDDLKIDETKTELIPLLGNYINNSNVSSVSKYSSSQLRLFKTLAYLHKSQDFKFDFTPLLFKPPLQISYGKSGIKGVSILGLNDIHPNDLKDCLEGTIVALHTIDYEVLNNVSKTNNDNLPILNSKNLLNNSSSDSLFFKSLVLIHSINEKEKLINLYIPSFEKIDKKDNEEFILIRGRTETPIWELASNQIQKEFKKETNLPFVTFDKTSIHDKVWKVRKNVQRRGQQ
ncbi:hypothetical protein BN7_4461 [Wickerhamomyces ciferrii]|uniref:Polynucleotide 5'-hydroxyl-kinase GRC3 n=1 Tax=Wickerhamomyces ciferrii (strain ATCC 14091 / BCRC 22168 / CBS 111 / JCM 3599 / NBRC 0793 / NRRL Y-1031 F-60-10) TaxID=1206466 RepID=K0KSB1_WICCF|nr:uncharacterized protein BN7_4461 [Wickerhamomyces ciferrii]CCH44892.1 hypothetical protein BN7_4461 [Wickerhamomyces ciferrii]